MVEIRVEREREKEKSVLWKLNASAADKGFGMNGSVKEYQSSKDMHGKSYNLAVDPSYDPSTIESQLIARVAAAFHFGELNTSQPL